MARTAVVAGTATAVSNRVSRRQTNHWSQQQSSYAEPQYYEPPPPPAPAPAPAAPAAAPDVVGQLTQLAELKAQGILTQEEFDAQKAKILAAS
jgi:Short C-terminal domain